MSQKTVVHLHNGILHSRKEEGAPTLCDSTDGSGERIASEISQVVKDKYHMISPIRGIHFYISRYLVFCSFYSQVLAGSILDE